MPVTIDETTEHFVTLDEVKRQTNITSTTHDEELMLIQGAAEDAVEGLVGPIRWRTVVESVRGSAAVLNVLPVVSLTSVSASGVTLAGVTVNAAAGMLTGLSYSGDVTATYVAGRTSCPDAIRMATLIIAAHLWRSQQGNSPSALPVEDDLGQDAYSVGFAIPRRAEDLLAPYLSLPGFV